MSLVDIENGLHGTGEGIGEGFNEVRNGMESIEYERAEPVEPAMNGPFEISDRACQRLKLSHTGDILDGDNYILSNSEKPECISSGATWRKILGAVVNAIQEYETRLIFDPWIRLGVVIIVAVGLYLCVQVFVHLLMLMTFAQIGAIGYETLMGLVLVIAYNVGQEAVFSAPAKVAQRVGERRTRVLYDRLQQRISNLSTIDYPLYRDEARKENFILALRFAPDSRRLDIIQYGLRLVRFYLRRQRRHHEARYVLHILPSEFSRLPHVRVTCPNCGNEFNADLGEAFIRCRQCLGVAPLDLPVLAKNEVVDAQSSHGLQTPGTVNLEASGPSTHVLNACNRQYMVDVSVCSASSESRMEDDSPTTSNADQRTTAGLRLEEAAKESVRDNLPLMAENRSLSRTTSAPVSDFRRRWPGQFGSTRSYGQGMHNVSRRSASLWVQSTDSHFV